MADSKQYLDYAGLEQYNEKVKAELAKKVSAETGKGLSTQDFTTEEKEKLSGLRNYTLPATSETTLGGVMVTTTENPVPEKTAVKADATGKVFVDWTEAPQASEAKAGLIKLGAGLKINPDTSAVEVDAENSAASSVPWSGITGKPDIALKSDITNVYKYKGSVATFDALPAEGNVVGDVYNVEATGMNYGWTGTEWDALGQVFQISAITDEQIDALFTPTV